MNDIWYTNDIDDYIVETDNIDDVAIKTGHIIAFFILGFIISILSGVQDTMGAVFLIARGFLGILLILSFFVPVRFGVPLFLILLLVGPDLVQATSEKSLYGEYNTASVWRLYIGPIRPSWIMFAGVLIQIVKTRNLVLDRSVKRAIVWFATVPLLTGLVYGGLTSFAWSIEVPADIRFAILLVTSIVLFHGFLRKYPDRLGVMLALFIGGLLGRHLCDLIYWFIGYGALMGGVSRASVDSTKSAVVFLLLFSIYLVMRKRKFFLGTAIGLGCGVLIIIYGTRMIWVTSALCSAILLYIFGAKRAIIAVPVIFILVAGSLKAVRSLRVESLEVVSQRAESFVTKGPENYLARLDPLRYGEIVNSMNTSMKRLALFWGNGYGSYYTDEVIHFPVGLTDAHPEYAAAKSKFFYCHNFLFQALFKHGIIGLVIIMAVWLVPAWVCYKLAFDRKNPSMFNGVLGCLIAFIPNAVINLWWSGKGIFVNGFIIGVLLVAVNLRQQSQEYTIEEAEYK